MVIKEVRGCVVNLSWRSIWVESEKYEGTHYMNFQGENIIERKSGY